MLPIKMHVAQVDHLGSASALDLADRGVGPNRDFLVGMGGRIAENLVLLVAALPEFGLRYERSGDERASNSQINSDAGVGLGILFCFFNASDQALNIRVARMLHPHSEAHIGLRFNPDNEILMLRQTALPEQRNAVDLSVQKQGMPPSDVSPRGMSFRWSGRKSNCRRVM